MLWSLRGQCMCPRFTVPDSRLGSWQEVGKPSVCRVVGPTLDRS